MKKLILIVILFFGGAALPAMAQTEAKNFYNKDFNWTVVIPQGFNSVSAEEWAKAQGRGAKAIEQTIDAKVENNTHTICVFIKDRFNCLEAVSQPYDVAKDGDYATTCKGVTDILYKTMAGQMPGAKLDSAYSTETIDGATFRVFKIESTFANGGKFTMMMHTRLVDKQELCVNIIYMDEQLGRQLLAAWKNSKFK